MKRFYTTSELAKKYGVTARTIRNWIYAGLPAERPRPRSPWRIPVSAVAPAQPRKALADAAQRLAALIEAYIDDETG